MPFESGRVTVTTSRTLQSVWGQTDAQVAQSSATAAASIVTTVASRGALAELQPIELNTFTAPKAPPVVPRVVPGALIAISDLPESTPRRPKFSIISDDIAEIRDQINALSNVLLGGRLLELLQERAILDVYKPASSPAEFRSRVQSLAGICVALNKVLLGQALGRETARDTGSVILLEEYLTKLAGSEGASAVCVVLKSINDLRKGYPAHGDNVDKFLGAHDFFGIPYPIEDFAAAWETILGAYLRVMKHMRDLLAAERAKNASATTGM